MIKDVSRGRILMGRIYRGEDLLDSLVGICRSEGVMLGRVAAIGAVENARIGFYDQELRVYEYLDLEGPMEILSLTGNVSILDGQPMVHAHITLGDEKGGAEGGHLASGTTVFACEYIIEELTGATMKRGYDEPTGLPLWED